MKRKPTVLLIYGSGGHAEQMGRLYRSLIDHFNSVNRDVLPEFVSVCDGEVSHPLTEATYMMPVVTDKYSYLHSFWKALKAIVVSPMLVWKIVRRHDVVGVISTGPGVTVPLVYLFKILGRKIWHVETWSRFTSKSLTGRFVYPIADAFWIQHESLQPVYPKGKYRGRL